MIKLKHNLGFTLIELTMSMTVLTILLGGLYTVGMGMVRAASTQDAKITLNQESRLAMQSVVKNLRMAQSASLLTNGGGGFAALGNAPVTNLQFTRVADVNGNASVLNQDLSVGTSQAFWYTVDTGDANGDGLTNTQLVQMNADGTVRRVLANHISPVVVTGDFYNTPRGGLVFQDVGGGTIQVTLIMRYQPDPTGPTMVTRLDELITPRN